MSQGGAGGNGRILALEPFYGGSHRAFLDGLAAQLPGELELLTMPARHWKARMRLAAPKLAAELDRRNLRGNEYRALLCSTYVDVAALRGLLPAGLRTLPIYTYFHENQFAYPVTAESERDLHFAITNLTTALASDRLAFNSAYNRETFLAGCRELFARSADLRLDGVEAAILAKSVILPPGQDFSVIDAAPPPEKREGAPVIVWNQRWEHDKNPEEFFAALFELAGRGSEFRLVVLGESFRATPPIFAEARQRLAGQILHFGFADSPADYAAWLKCGDLVVSTANHEFFGIAVVEAVRAGCRPLLPNRLAYPEYFPGESLYGDGELVGRLTEGLKAGRLSKDKALSLTDRFAWPALLDQYREWLDFGE
jgi:glycosyltransferase involved in cell wall biosynthesis